MTLTNATHAALLAGAISHIGMPTFGKRLDDVIEEICPIDFCACYRIGSETVDVIAMTDPLKYGSGVRVDSYSRRDLWRSDPALFQAKQTLEEGNSAHARLRTQDLPNGDLKSLVYPHLVDRLLMCGKDTSGAFAVSMIRWEDSRPFQPVEIETLLGIGTVIIALVSKHSSLISAPFQNWQPFSSLPVAERCLAQMNKMPHRERQVCARLLCGNTVPAIAQALGLSGETIKSYVKRAYVRLGISSRQDLTVMYLKQWSAMRAPLICHNFP